MSQGGKFLTSLYREETITAIIEEAMNQSQSIQLHIIECRGSQPYILTAGQLALIRKNNPKQAKVLIQAARMEQIGSLSRIAEFRYEQRTGYADIRADEKNLALIYAVFGEGDEQSKQGMTTTPPIESRNDLPPYLDKTHPQFAPELYVAVKAWLDIFNGEEVNSNIGVETKFKKWLKVQNHVSRGKEVNKRISTIITPKHLKTKRGANPTISLKKIMGHP